MRRYLSAMILAAALGGPVVAMAADQPQRFDQRQRFYDQDRRDYHEWNDREERAYRHWLEANHRKYREWKHASRRDQNAYWKWRHSHPGDDWRM
jgi:hypothetical protein